MQILRISNFNQALAFPSHSVTQLVPIKQFICKAIQYIIDAVLVPLS